MALLVTLKINVIILGFSRPACPPHCRICWVGIFSNARQMLCCELLKGHYPKHPRHYLTLDTTHSSTLNTCSRNVHNVHLILMQVHSSSCTNLYSILCKKFVSPGRILCKKAYHTCKISLKVTLQCTWVLYKLPIHAS